MVTFALAVAVDGDRRRVVVKCEVPGEERVVSAFW
jgi:hypothetical protein